MRGSVLKLITHEKDMFLISDRHKVLDFVGQIDSINRAKCRQTVEDRFSVDRMIRHYSDVYTLIMERVT